MNNDTVSRPNYLLTTALVTSTVMLLTGFVFAQSSVSTRGVVNSAFGGRHRPNPISGGLLALSTDSIFFGDVSVGASKNDTMFAMADFDSVHVDSVLASDGELVISPQSAFISASPADTIPFVLALNPTSPGAKTITISFYWSYRSFGSWFPSATPAECYATDTSEASLNALLVSETAAFAEGSVELNFKTSSEVSVAGFEISRSASEVGPFTMLSDYTTNTSLRARGVAGAGAEYTYSDSKSLSAGTYYYKIVEVDLNGSAKQLGSTIVVNVEIPDGYSLEQNYPNPFNPSTTVSFDIKQTSAARLEIFNILGERILVDDYGTLSPGKYDRLIDLDKFASGIYYYRLTAQSEAGQLFVTTRKMTLLK